MNWEIVDEHPNPFHARLAKDKTGRHNSSGVSHRRSKAQERDLAKRLDAKTTLASGSKAEKGDVRKHGVIRIEAKTTKNKSFSLTREMVSKIEDAALPCNEIPAIVVEFIDEEGNPVMEVAILPTYVLEHICQDET